MIELKGDEKEPCIYHGFFTVYCWACAFGDDFVDTLFMDGGIAFWEKKREVCWRSPDTDLMETCIGTGTAMRMWKNITYADTDILVYSGPWGRKRKH